MNDGAGVNKTAVLKVVYQSLVRLYNKTPGENPDTIKVWLYAPTGSAAFLMKGNRIHWWLNIHHNQGLKYKSLTVDK